MRILTQTNGFPHDEEKEIEGCSQRLVSVRNLAAVCSVSERAIWRLLASGVLPKPIKIGGCTRFLLSEILQWLDGLKEQRV